MPMLTLGGDERITHASTMMPESLCNGAGREVNLRYLQFDRDLPEPNAPGGNSLPQRRGRRRLNTQPIILVIEDDPLLQSMVHDALSEGGFHTEIVSSGEEAIKVLDTHKHRALVTDINLHAELTGWDVARRARELSPEIPVIYMTGAAANEWPSLGVPNSVLLNKPFAAAQLVTAVAQMLNTVDPPT